MAKSQQQQNVVFFSAILATMALISVQVGQVSGNLVETAESTVFPGGRHVAVHIPGVYSLDLDTRAGQHNGVRMSQSVLGGFVRVNMDRSRGANNQMQGPLQVSVGGMTMYNNNELSPGA